MSSNTDHRWIWRRVHVTLALLDILVPPFVANRLRMTILRLAAGLDIGPRTLMWDVPRIEGSEDPRTALSIGAGCGFNVGCYFLLDDPITIGDEVSCGHEVKFLSRPADAAGAADADRTDTADGGPTAGRGIVVGAGSWLGARCVVMAGVTIGPGSVIGAGTVVRTDVPPNTLVNGRQSVSLARWR